MPPVIKIFPFGRPKAEEYPYNRRLEGGSMTLNCSVSKSNS